ncbi:Predicted dehydrogenase [Catalinimonas alkaloidigena]|uniref:Predicted dehydrogenase n=1 Tax=Catalinimonas alkaloidigena TaxID=1075417 RepID=A0A1G9RS91_9BACT|nr:Gfo/Idh/MocA family oxidoreductase [Catalinimonas alkaloidigena]SDM25365.1 Predicted dehydrogenase [Catalinimonas alkaloidigena]
MSQSFHRRIFLRRTALGVGSILAAPLAFSACTPSSNPSDTASTDTTAQANANDPQNRKLGVALVGLGSYATHQLAPALAEAQHCYLAGIVTGTPEKAEEWKKKYNIPDKNVYNYETYDQIADNPDIDIVYVVLPNSMHAEYVIRGAKAGKHMITEKPMAISVEECDQMIAACKEANRKLSVGYRLHFEPHNKEMMRLGQQQVFGPVKKISGADSFKIGDPDQWRLDKELAGGGPLMDVGIYCVQGACYTLGKEPTAITARFGEVTDPKKFDEVEETIIWQMEFPDGVTADFVSSYNQNGAKLRAEAENGWFELDPAYGYDGLKGETSEGKMDFPQVREQTLQMDDFALCVRENRESIVPGEMGRRDMKILTAIYEAARTGKKVQLT